MAIVPSVLTRRSRVPTHGSSPPAETPAGVPVSRLLKGEKREENEREAKMVSERTFQRAAGVSQTSALRSPNSRSGRNRADSCAMRRPRPSHSAAARSSSCAEGGSQGTNPTSKGGEPAEDVDDAVARVAEVGTPRESLQVGHSGGLQGVGRRHVYQKRPLHRGEPEKEEREGSWGSRASRARGGGGQTASRGLARLAPRAEERRLLARAPHPPMQAGL